MEGNCVQKFVNPSAKSTCKKNVHLVEMSIVYKSVTSLHFSDIYMKHHPEEITQIHVCRIMCDFFGTGLYLGIGEQLKG